MRINSLLLLCVVALSIACAVSSAAISNASSRARALMTDPPATRGENLVPNGDFEKGKTTPDAWQTIDGLSSFWIDDPEPGGKRGKVLKLDTDVLQSQAYAWWAKIVENVEPQDAPKKSPTVEPKYDTLAGLDGVWFWSDFIPVEKGKKYWLTVDVKGPGMKVFLRGYAEKGSTVFGAEADAFQGYLRDPTGKIELKRGFKKQLKKYVWDAWYPAGGSDAWQTYARREKPFDPTSNTPNVRYVRVMIYPYWPPATYFVDNVRLLEVAE